MPTELQSPLWEWWIVLYFFVGGIAGGAYFTAAVIELVGRPEDRPIARMGYYIAFPLALLSGLFLILDLGAPERFWHMIVYSRTFLPWPKWDSPISVGAYALLFFGVFSFLSFLDALVETGRLKRAPFRLKYNSTPRMIYSILGGLVGFFLASYTGVLLAHTHLPVWADTPLLGALFVASGASTGMAAIALGLALTKVDVGQSWARLKQADNMAIILEIVLLVVLLALLGAAAGPILNGVNGILLIGGVLILGLIIPLALQFRAGFQGMKTTTRLTLLTAILILIGGLIMRTVIVMGGQELL
ncbi:MAG TPA: NrfD/PsrC family molybdoenzyme membrane anchor subunit [Anaerolineae bacterium]|nr:NrfD/PsrC family molybdoenzyme membrane anchor subunit [Anaerolineae bacterium]